MLSLPHSFTLHFGLFSNIANCTFLQFYISLCLCSLGKDLIISCWMITSSHHPRSSYFLRWFFFWCILCSYSKAMDRSPGILKGSFSRWLGGQGGPCHEQLLLAVPFSLLSHHGSPMLFHWNQHAKSNLKERQFCFIFQNFPIWEVYPSQEDMNNLYPNIAFHLSLRKWKPATCAS